MLMIGRSNANRVGSFVDTMACVWADGACGQILNMLGHWAWKKKQGRLHGCSVRIVKRGVV